MILKFKLSRSNLAGLFAARRSNLARFRSNLSFYSLNLSSCF
ncbi:hypothetical protein CAMSH0001_1649 [Campylobacter showae RM3277]|uniref:Uncharacterized protein n=1 Tax=Campylobacter showae RM3277 TaxID=553219 RepID=C6RH15_9BACT|nr:hypothetical protein CAMSH0001_1649 [Campylobacter showae RM3277]